MGELQQDAAIPKIQAEENVSEADAFAAMGADVSGDDCISSTARKEEEAIVQSEQEEEYRRREKIRNDSDEQDMGERKRYADNAYAITQAWIGFLIVVTIMQMALRPINMNLEVE